MGKDTMEQSGIAGRQHSYVGGVLPSGDTAGEKPMREMRRTVREEEWSLAQLTDQIPSCGLLLAYYASELLFVPYEVRNAALCIPGGALREDDIPREMHFFNEKEEYRVVRRSFHRDYVILCLTGEEEDQMDPDLVFSEEVLLRPEYAGRKGCPERIRIVNRYRYSEYDTLVLDNYRLSTV